MRHLLLISLGTLFITACGGASPNPASNAPPSPAPTTGSSSEVTKSASDKDPAPRGDSPSAKNEFRLNDTQKTAGREHERTVSQIQATATEAAMKFFIVDKNKGPIPGIVISMAAPDGKKYFTKESDSEGYAEVLVPVGQKYKLVYLSLGRKDVTASVPVNNDKNQNIRLTLRYKTRVPPKTPDRKGPAGFVLKGIYFDTGKANIRPESAPQLDSLIEYMTHKLSAHIEITGHTDTVGKAANNKKLSERRAQSVRRYLIGEGIDASRIEALGMGGEQPIATNDTEEGRQKNRRIEAREL